MAVKKVESLRKGLEVLEAFSSRGAGLTLQELTEITELPKPTAYRFLQTLLSLNYIHYFPNSRQYRLGPKVMSLGFSLLSSLDIGDVAQPYLEELSQQIEQNVNLGILDGLEVVYVIRIKRRKILGIDLSVGSRLSAHNTAIGQAILAFSDSRQVEHVIAEICRSPETSKSIGPDGALLRKKLATVRQNGFSVSDDEYIPGLRSIGIPIFKGKDEAEAAINVPVFSQFCTQEKLMNEYLPLARNIAKTISQLRGHDPD